MIYLYHIEPKTKGTGCRQLYAAPGLDASEKSQKAGRRYALKHYAKMWGKEGVITGYSLHPENKKEAQKLSRSSLRARPDSATRNA